MKKTIILGLTALLFSASYFLLSCQHTIPVGADCDNLNFQITATSSNATSGNSDGMITVTASGGEGFYFNLNGGSNNTTGVYNNLAAGNYTIIGHNSAGCSDTVQINVGTTNPCTGVNIIINSTPTNPSVGQSNGSITATAIPAGSYTYNINGGAFQPTGVFNNLGAGSYTIVAKNSTGCTGTTTITLVENNPCSGVNISISSTPTNPTVGQSNGSITATATPAGTYTYSINGGAFQATGVFNNLSAGSYTITAKNSNGCTGTSTISLVETNPCTGVTISISSTQTNPFTGQTNGSITATASPAGTYTYSKNGGAFQATGVFNNLSAGSYTITAKNSNGCTGTTIVVLTAINPCTGINIGITPTVSNVVPCTTPTANGSISVAASGSSGYTYNSNGGAYQSSSIFAGLAAGNYIIGVKDLNGCTNTQTVVVGTATMGPNFTNVRNIIRANCGSCHLNGGNTAGYNFDNDCSIVSYWSQIKGSCVSPYTLRRMPTSGALSATLQAQITAWVNAGHKYTD